MPAADISINGVDGSDTDLPINTLVQLDNQNIGGETTYAWTIIDQPPTGASDILSSAVIQNPSFTPKKEGTYLIQLVVNATLPSEQTDTVVAAVRHLKSRERVPAAGEETQADASDGWAQDAGQNDGATAGSFGYLRRIDDQFNSDFGIAVGQAGAAGIVKGDVVRCSNVATIKSGLPGQEVVPLFTKALATVIGNVDELLGICEGGVNGAASPANGDLIRVRIAGLYSATVVGVPTTGNPVYVSDAGAISLTPGAVARKIGTAVAPSGGSYRVWVLGASAADTSYIEALLNNDPTAETGATDTTQTLTYGSGLVTLEAWTRNDATLLKSIAYTYAANKVATEIRKVFDTNGTTILAQVTWTYSYTGELLTTATMVRDV